MSVHCTYIAMDTIIITLSRYKNKSKFKDKQTVTPYSMMYCFIKIHSQFTNKNIISQSMTYGTIQYSKNKTYRPIYMILLGFILSSQMKQRNTTQYDVRCFLFLKNSYVYIFKKAICSTVSVLMILVSRIEKNFAPKI